MTAGRASASLRIFIGVRMGVSFVENGKAY